MRILLVICIAVAGAGGFYDPLTIGSEWLINGYKTVVSPLQGRNMCNFWPTCSQFMKQAIHTYGLFPGSIIGAERLMRCHTIAWSYYDKYYFGISHNRLRDPLENHLVWQLPSAEPENLTVIAIEPEHVPASQKTQPAPISSLGFANHLYATEDYPRAATEYLRVSFTDTNQAVRTYAGLMAGESFLKAGKYEHARTAFHKLATPASIDIARFGIARAWFAQGRYKRTRMVLDSIDDHKLAYQRHALTGWTLFKEQQFAQASSLFKPDSTDSLLSALAMLDGRDLPTRNRLAGSLLSAIVPGAGQLYAGRAGDGAYSFLTVAGTGLLTYWFAAHPDKDNTRIKLSVSGTLTALFYIANIYGANIAARDYNRFHKRKYLARAEQILHRLKLEPDYMP